MTRKNGQQKMVQKMFEKKIEVENAIDNNELQLWTVIAANVKRATKLFTAHTHMHSQKSTICVIYQVCLGGVVVGGGAATAATAVAAAKKCRISTL